MTAVQGTSADGADEADGAGSSDVAEAANAREADGGGGWFAVRCVFRWDGWDGLEPDAGTPYEERFTLWSAASLGEALSLAEREAHAYAHEHGFTYVDFADAYELATPGRPGHGDEVFSLLRDSPLDPAAYVSHHFATGSEHMTESP